LPSVSRLFSPLVLFKPVLLFRRSLVPTFFLLRCEVWGEDVVSDGLGTQDKFLLGKVLEGQPA
jgi:hypothetical protein